MLAYVAGALGLKVFRCSYLRAQILSKVKQPVHEVVWKPGCHPLHEFNFGEPEDAPRGLSPHLLWQHLEDSKFFQTETIVDYIMACLVNKKQAVHQDGTLVETDGG